MQIVVQFSRRWLFDSDMEGVDIKSSFTAYKTLLAGALKEAYPEAEIEVIAGDNDSISVDNVNTDEDGFIADIIYNVDIIKQGVWEDGEWVVHIPKPSPPDLLKDAKHYANYAEGFVEAKDAANLALAYAAIALVEELRAIKKNGLNVHQDSYEI